MTSICSWTRLCSRGGRARPALLLALLLLAGSAAAAPDEFQRRYEDGKARYQAGDNEGAIRAFEAAYAVDPVPGVLFNIGQAYLKLGRPQEALRYYERYLETGPRLGERERRKVEGAITDARAQIAAGVAVERALRGAPPAAAPGAAPAGAPGAPAVPGLASPGVAGASIAAPGAPAPGGALATAPAPTPGAPPRPLYRRWWFWGAVGLAAAGAALGAGLGASAASRDPYGGVAADRRWRPEL